MPLSTGEKLFQIDRNHKGSFPLESTIFYRVTTEILYQEVNKVNKICCSQFFRDDTMIRHCTCTRINNRATLLLANKNGYANPLNCS